MGKIKVSKGTDTLEIDGADLPFAIKDGYKPSQKLIVANSKTGEQYEVGEDDVEAALNEGFSFQDIAQQKDIVQLAKERKKAKGLQLSGQGYGYGGGVSEEIVNERKKELADIETQIKDQGYDVDFAEDISNLPEGQGFSARESIPALKQLRDTNKFRYNREVSAIKSKGELFNAIRNRSDVKNAAGLIQRLQGLEKENYQVGTRDAIALTKEYVDDPEQQQKIIQNIVQDKSYDYGIQPFQQDERFVHLNPYQQRAMNFLKDVDQGTYGAYERIMSVNPETQWLGSTENAVRRGFETKGRELENIGMSLEMKAYEERLTDLQNKGELTPQEQQEQQNLIAKYQELAKDKETQRERYPNVAAMDADKLMQESMGATNSVAKKFALGVGENFDDAINWVGDLLQDRGVTGDLELLGDKELTGVMRYTPEKDKLIGSEIIAKFDDQLQSEVDQIKNSQLSEDEKRDQIKQVILDNQDKVSYVPNDRSGKANFTAKAIFNAVGEVGSEIVSQMAIAALSGGAGNASKLKQLSGLFGSTFATAYNDYYADALRQDIPNPTQYAITHTAIEAASELINNDFEVVKMMVGKTGALGKVLSNVTQEEWKKIAKKGFFSKLKDASVQAGEKSLKNAIQETTEETAGQLAGNLADQNMFNKEVGIGEGVGDTMVQTMVGTLPLGLLSLPFNFQNINRQQKYAMYEAGMNPDKFKQSVQQAQAEGTITPAEAAVRIENIDRAAQAVQSSQALRTDGQPMTDNEKTEYAFNQSVLQEIKEQKKNAPAEVKEQLEETEEKLNKEQAELLKPKKVKKTEEQKLIEKAVKDKKIPDVLADQAKANPQEFFKMVADQAFGRTETGEMSSEPNAEYAVREQYGDKIVDKAKELYPLTQTTIPDAKTIRSDQGQIPEGGNAREGSQNQSSQDLQPPAVNAPIDAEVEQQTQGEEITPDTLEQELQQMRSATEQREEKEPEVVSAFFAGGKVTGKVIGKLPDGRVTIQDKKGLKYNIKPKDILKEGETPYEHYEKTKKLPKLGSFQADQKRPQNEDVTQYTPQSIIQKAKEFYGEDPLINRVANFLQPIMDANPNIRIDTTAEVPSGVLGYSYGDGRIELNFNQIKDYDTLYRTALHEMVHAATRNEIKKNTAFQEDLQKVLGEVRQAMKLPDNGAVISAFVARGIIDENKYGAANEYELLAEVFTNQKFYEALKGMEYKGDNMLHRLFLAIAKWFSKQYKALKGAKESISVDNLADYLMALTESIVTAPQTTQEEGALPLIRPSERDTLIRIIERYQGRISDADLRGKLKQIAGLSDQEIDELISAAAQPATAAAAPPILRADQVGEVPEAPKEKGKVRKLYDKYFTSSKGLPKWMLTLKDQASGGVHLEIRQALQLVNKAKTTAKKIGFNDWDLFDKSLREQYYGSDLASLKALPPEMQVISVAMRNKIDALGRDLIINNYVTPEQALNIEANMGEYITRSYRAFNEKDWGKKVPKEVRQEAFRMLAQEYFPQADQNLSFDEQVKWAEDQANLELNRIIAGISDKYTPDKTSQIKGANLGILQRRQDVPKEIRDLLGEYTDPGVNFALTIGRIASLKSSMEFMTKVRQLGMGNIFWEADNRPPEASVQIASDSNKAWDPLAGLYTTPEVKEVFKEAEEKQHSLVKLWMRIVGTIRWGKTVGSVVTQIKNFESNIGFAVMNGHYRAGKAGESFKFMKDKLFGKEMSDDAIIEKAVRLGIVDQSVGMRELKEMFNTDSLDKVILKTSLNQKSPIKRIGRSAGNVIGYLNKIYGTSDDFWKIYGFLNEAESLSNARFNKSYKDLTPEEQADIDVEASERTKNIYPTYDRVWEGAKILSKGLPIFGNFLSFQAESLRVLRNTISYAYNDLKDPATAKMGAQRLAGITAYLSIRTTVLYAIAQMTGVGMAGVLGIGNDDEEEQKLKDINNYGPTFIRSGDKLAIDNGNGKYTVYDVGSLEPYGSIFKTMNALTEGSEGVKDPGLLAAMDQLLGPYIELEMTVGTLMQLYNNETEGGGQIYNPLDPEGDQVLDKIGYVLKKMRPSTIDLISRIAAKEDKGNEVAAAFGGRGYEIDAAKGFSFKLRAASELFEANRNALNKIKFKEGTSDEEKQEAEKLFEERNNKIIELLSEDYQSAIRLGVNPETLDEALARKKFFQGYTKDVKQKIKTGIIGEEQEEPGTTNW